MNENIFYFILIVSLALLLLALYFWHKLSLTRQENERLTNNISDMTTKALSLESEVEQLKIEREEQQYKYIQQDSELANLKNQSVNLLHEVHNLQQQIKESKEQLFSQIEKNTRTEGECALTQQKYTSLVQELNEKQHNYQEQIKELKQQQQLQLEQTKQQYQRELNATTQTHQEQLKQLKASHEQQLQQQKTAIEEQLSFIKEQTNTNLKLIREEVQNSANKLVKDTSTSFFNESVNKINLITEPLKEKMLELTTNARQLLDKNIQTDAKFITKINDFDKQINLIREYSTNLSNALRGTNKKALGNWGEQQLEVTLNALGLIKGMHYQMQPVFQVNNQKLIPDCVLNLPGNRKIIIDSKTTLNSYLKAFEAQTKEQEKEAREELVKNIQAHIKNLAEKNYQKIPELKSTDFVLMYIPIDNVLAYLAEEKPEIFLEAQKQNVVIVSNSTLIPLLSLIDGVWKNHDFSNNVRKLAEQANSFFEAVIRIAQRSHALGNGVRTLHKQYNELIKALGSSKGAIARVERFNNSAQKALLELDNLQKLELETDGDPEQKLNEFVSEQLLPNSDPEFFAKLATAQEEAEPTQDQASSLKREEDNSTAVLEEKSLALTEQAEGEPEQDEEKTEQLKLEQTQEQASILGQESLSRQETEVDSDDLAVEVQKQLQFISQDLKEKQDQQSNSSFFAEYDAIFKEYEDLTKP
ncbi:DNA recombination protein RmuC [Psittacicella gerlachiana]|uniref:DNA recombination protein RmuC n=1 Tax=Psittacicella gerlachiana TaxID=2028574 RepID=A0A3A1YK56_9GAMM|nr:DNA recombination protein RmuC [Psittacicella gerlachiana]RIY38572.1 hypothetical protein CKF59_00605 [Psittacicella gerlachiana]